MSSTTSNISPYMQTQQVSTFVSRRELNQSSPVYTGGLNQLPVRLNVANQRTRQTQQGNNMYKYEANKANNRIVQNQRHVSSVGKAQIQQRYRSTEGEKRQERLEKSGNGLNRRVIPMTFGSNNNFNNNGKTKDARSKSTMNPTSEFLKDFMKQGEDITEKIYPGKNNKLVVETRKVEVFKNMNPNSKSKSKVKKTGENTTEKIFKNLDNKLINERRTVEVFQVNKPNIPKDIKMISTENGEYALRIQRSKKYIDREKETIQQTRENETIINERRRDNKKIIREPGRREDIDAKKSQLRKEGEKITEKIIPGPNDNLILEKRKVEVFRDLNYKKDKSKLQITSQSRRGQIATTKRFKEENGIDKYYIKEKMIEIWLDESSKTRENSFTLASEEGKFLSYQTKNTSSNQTYNYLDADKQGINQLIKMIKEKDNELNRIANQLKAEMGKNKYGTHTSRREEIVSTSKNVYNSNTANALNRSNLTLESNLHILLSKIKEKDEYINKLLNKIRTQQNVTNEYDQRTSSRISGKFIERSTESDSKDNRHSVKNVYETINKTIEEFDTINTQTIIRFYI